MGFVDTSCGGITELRVHGVQDTPPEAMLCHPHAQRVAGDRTTGFFRRVWESRLTSGDSEARRLEAYSWGGLTSGGWSRALWLLLVPFALVNVAVFMLPFPFRIPPRERPENADGFEDPEDPERGRRRVAEAAARVLALALTVTLVLGACGVFLDLLAWQCGYHPAGSPRCTTRPPLGLLVFEVLTRPTQRLALGAVVVLAIIGLLWWLGLSTWQAHEVLEPKSASPEARQLWRSPLESRDFWRGGEPVRRLRFLHVGAAFAVVGVLETAPDVAALPAGRVPLLARALVALGLVVLACCLVAVLQPSLTERLGPREGDGRRQDPTRRREFVLLVAGAFVAAGANALGWLAPVVGLDQPGRSHLETLPWFTAASRITFLIEAGAVLVLGVTVASSAYRWRRGRDVPWWGFGSLGFSLLGWALAGGLAVAVHLWVAGGLGYPANDATIHGDEPNRLIVPLAYFWGGAALVVVLAALVITVVVVLLVAQAARRRMLLGRPIPKRRPAGIDLSSLYPDDLVLPLSTDAERRQRAVAWQIALGQTTPIGIRAVGWLFTVASLIVITAAVLDLTVGTWIVTSGSWLSSSGSWLLAFAAAAFFGLAYKAYDTPTLRRTVGILWDLGTFWPRATHPLAPPCYAERSVPELLDRIHYLAGPPCVTAEGDADGQGRPTSRVLLSCHSQGTIIGAAVVAASTYDDLSRLSFLTYGCPLRRLYARFFPRYFNEDFLERLGRLLHEGAGPAVAPGPWPWINLYRLSDPIGGYVFESVQVARPSVPVQRLGTGPAAVDLQLIDPLFRRADGDPAFPIALGHSDYWLDPVFAAAAALLEQPTAGVPAQTTKEPPDPSDQAQAASAAAPPTTARSATTPR